ncbi:MAG: BTAD domain-containing putative transcriptional regulator, partial [Gemmatimonadota bacterium]
MIWFQTFGGVAVFDEAGNPMLGAASHRRTFGMLAVLAAAGEAGLSRDKLVGIFWPEFEPRRARHSLTQAVYAARKGLACDDVFEISEDIRLNPARIQTDIGQFEAALRTGDDEAALALYRGPFLDGLFLASQEFDNWLAHERIRLEDLAVGALERLAQRAEQSGDTRLLIERLRKLSAIRPSDSAVTLRLMRALAAAGDRAAAIQHAALHARTMRELYEVEPDHEVVDLAEELRNPAGERQAANRTAMARERIAEPVELIAVSRRARDAQLSEITYRAAPRARWKLRVLPILLLAALVSLGLIMRGRNADRDLGRLDQQIVVAPFRVVGAESSLAYLREGLVELLSARLSDDSAARSVDAGAAIRAWRRAGITRAPDASRDTMVGLARRLGAKRVIVGSVVGTPEQAIVTASVVSAESGQVSAEASVEGPIDSLTHMVDRLAGKLLVTEAGADEHLSERTTASLPALRAYLAGISSYASGDYALALSHHARALQLDESFALAALHMALAAGRLHRYGAEREALHRAWLLRDGLSGRDRAHLTALVGPAYPAPSRSAAVLEAWEAAARLAPNRAEVWYGLASAIAQQRAFRPSGDDYERASAALQRARELDPGFARAYLLLARITPETTASAATLPGDSVEALAPFMRWLSEARAGDTTKLALLADSLTGFGPANLRTLAAVSQFEGVRLQDAERALRILLDRSHGSQESLELAIALHSLALNRSDSAAALEVTRQLQRLRPATRAHLRLRVLDAVFANGDSIAASNAARELVAATAAGRGISVAADACALGQWFLARSDTARARLSLETLRAYMEAELVPVGAAAPYCAA